MTDFNAVFTEINARNIYQFNTKIGIVFRRGSAGSPRVLNAGKFASALELFQFIETLGSRGLSTSIDLTVSEKINPLKGQP